MSTLPFCALVFYFVICSGLFDIPGTAEKIRDGKTSSSCFINDVTQVRVPMHRYFHFGRKDHYYTTVKTAESDKELAASGYKFQFTEGKVLRKPATGTLAVHQFFSNRSFNHFYTTQWEDPDLQKLVYKYEGIVFYIYPDPIDETVPLFRYYHAGHENHFYTPNWTELEAGRHGFTIQKIQGYIFPMQ